MNTNSKTAIAQIIQEICDQGARLIHYIQSRITAVKNALKELISFCLKAILQLLLVLKLAVIVALFVGPLSLVCNIALKALLQRDDIRKLLSENTWITPGVHLVVVLIVGGVLWQTYSLQPEDARKTLSLRLCLVGLVSMVLFSVNAQLSPLGWFAALEGFEYIKAATALITGILFLEVIVPALIRIATNVATL